MDFRRNRKKEARCMEDQTLREEICQICRWLYERGYVVSNDGNVSARTQRGTVLITPSGVGKGRVTAEMLVETDLTGRVLRGDRHPSSEGKMHWMVYQERGDVNAVVHAHPPVSTAFSVCRRGLTKKYLIEMAQEVPVTQFALPSTQEVPDSVRPYVRDHWAVLLANHGALAWGGTLLSAFDRLETVEQTAKVCFYVERMGGGVELTQAQLESLHGLSGYYEKLARKREEGED